MKKKIWEIRQERLIRKVKAAGILCIERGGHYYLPKIGKNIHASGHWFRRIVLTEVWGLPARFFTWRQFLKYYDENKVR